MLFTRMLNVVSILLNVIMLKVIMLSMMVNVTFASVAVLNVAARKISFAYLKNLNSRMPDAKYIYSVNIF